MAINFGHDAAQNQGQPAKRRAMRFTDQHGRKWHGSIEIKSGYPIRVRPMFTAPLVVPPNYLRFDPNEPNLITIAYEAWISDIEAAHQRWNDNLRKGAIKLYGEKAPEAIANPSAVLLDMVGAKPGPVEPVLAALGGNKWILGLSENKPSWAETYFATPAPVATTMAVDMDMDERIAQLAEKFPDVEDERFSENDNVAFVSPDESGNTRFQFGDE